MRKYRAYVWLHEQSSCSRQTNLCIHFAGLLCSLRPFLRQSRHQDRTWGLLSVYGHDTQALLGWNPACYFSLNASLNACYCICFWMRLCMFSTCAFYLLHDHRWQVQQAKLVAQRAPSALTPWAEVCYDCYGRVEIDERWPERRQTQVTWCLLRKEPKRVGNRKQFIKWIQSQGLVLPYYVHEGGGPATVGIGASLGRGGFQCRFVKKQDMCIWSSARLFA